MIALIIAKFGIGYQVPGRGTLHPEIIKKYFREFVVVVIMGRSYYPEKQFILGLI